MTRQSEDEDENAKVLYPPSEVARQLGVTQTSLRRYAAAYEALHGPLPRDPQQRRLWPHAAAQRLQRAKTALDAGEVVSLRAGLAAEGQQSSPEPKPKPVLADDALTTSTSQPTLDRALVSDLLGEIRQLRDQLDRSGPHIDQLTADRLRLEEKADELTRRNALLEAALAEATRPRTQKPNRIGAAFSKMIDWFTKR